MWKLTKKLIRKKYLFAPSFRGKRSQRGRKIDWGRITELTFSGDMTQVSLWVCVLTKTLRWAFKSVLGWEGEDDSQTGPTPTPMAEHLPLRPSCGSLWLCLHASRSRLAGPLSTAFGFYKWTAWINQIKAGFSFQFTLFKQYLEQKDKRLQEAAHERPSHDGFIRCFKAIHPCDKDQAIQRHTNNKIK